MGLLLPKNANMELQRDGTWSQTAPDNRKLAGANGEPIVIMTSDGVKDYLPKGSVMTANMSGKATTHADGSPIAITRIGDKIFKFAAGNYTKIDANGVFNDNLSASDRRELFGEDERGHLLPPHMLDALIQGALGEGEIVSEAEAEQAKLTQEEEDALEEALVASLEYEMAKDADDQLAEDVEKEMVRKVEETRKVVEDAQKSAEAKKGAEAQNPTEAQATTEAKKIVERMGLNLTSTRKLSDSELDDPNFSMPRVPEKPGKTAAQLKKEAEAAEKLKRRQRALEGFQQREEDREAGRAIHPANLSAWDQLHKHKAPAKSLTDGADADNDADTDEVRIISAPEYFEKQKVKKAAGKDGENAITVKPPKKQSSRAPRKSQANTSTQSQVNHQPPLFVPEDEASPENGEIVDWAEAVTVYQDSMFELSQHADRYEGLTMELYTKEEDAVQAFGDNVLNDPHLVVFNHDDGRMELAIAGMGHGKAVPAGSVYSIIEVCHEAVASTAGVQIDEYSGDNVARFLEDNALNELRIVVFKHPNGLVEMIASCVPDRKALEASNKATSSPTEDTKSVLNYVKPTPTPFIKYEPPTIEMSDEKRQQVAAIYMPLKDWQRETLAYTAPSERSTIEEIRAAADGITGRRKMFGKVDLAGDQFFSFAKVDPNEDVTPHLGRSDIHEVPSSEIGKTPVGKRKGNTRPALGRDGAPLSTADFPVKSIGKRKRDAMNDGAVFVEEDTPLSKKQRAEDTVIDLSNTDDEAYDMLMGPLTAPMKRKRVVSDDEESDDEGLPPSKKMREDEAVVEPIEDDDTNADAVAPPVTTAPATRGSPPDTTGSEAQDIETDEVATVTDTDEADQLSAHVLKQRANKAKREAKGAARQAKQTPKKAKPDGTPGAPQKPRQVKKPTGTKRVAKKTVTAGPDEAVAPTDSAFTAPTSTGTKKRRHGDTNEETETKGPAKKRGKKG